MQSYPDMGMWASVRPPPQFFSLAGVGRRREHGRCGGGENKIDEVGRSGVRGGEQMERDKDGLASLDGVLRGVLLADDI